MNTKSFVAAVLLTFVFAFAVFAQHDHSSQEKSKSKSMSDMMGQPTFEKSLDGTSIKVWLITQEEHKKMMDQGMSDKHSEGHEMEMMGDKTTKENKDSSRHDHMMHGDMKDMDHGMMGKGMKHDMKGADHKNMMEAMMSGTHHVMVTITDEKTGKAPEKSDVTLILTTASKKTSTVELKEMMNHFGSGVSLEEKGTYTFTIEVKVGSKHNEMSFSYEVK